MPSTPSEPERSLEEAFDAFLAGTIAGWDLPYPLSYCYQRGRWDVEPERDAANDEADRWHRIATPERLRVPTTTLADLERRRGYPQRAERIEADLRRRFGDTAA